MLDLLEVLRNAVLITGLVLIMMLMIEYCNIGSHGSLFARLKSSGINQVLIGTLLGLVPGCIGGFAAVSLFTHKLLSFGALTAMMIASSGDEAFVMLATMPLKALLLFAILGALAIVTGLVCDRYLFKEQNFAFCPDGYEIHKEHDSSIASPFRLSSYKDALRRPSRERLLLLAGIALFVVALLSGFAGHDHAGHDHAGHDHAVHQEVALHQEVAHNHELHEEAEHNHALHEEAAHNHTLHEHVAHQESLQEIIEERHLSTFTLHLLDEEWMNCLFAIMSIVTLLFTATAKEHFIKEHLWHHVIKRHLLSIFLWTLGGLAVCQIGVQYLNIEEWVSSNMIFVILLAVAVGIIPESGPHLVFVTLYLNGIVPFSVLLANSISQDGHTALPLLASSRKTFLKAKAVNIIIGAVVGILLYLSGL
ncbi:MAG: putative manganese transporter, partial [Candidatus Egerieousia sp.]|nr:putative manganese transporter [bacterium]MDY5255289.1 putative manganese transporter [Candidatus Egerieousia sp.]